MGNAIRIKDNTRTLINEIKELEGFGMPEKVNYIILDWILKRRLSKVRKEAIEKELNAENHKMELLDKLRDLMKKNKLDEDLINVDILRELRKKGLSPEASEIMEAYYSKKKL